MEQKTIRMTLVGAIALVSALAGAETVRVTVGGADIGGLQDKIDSVAAQGGGVVRVEAGEHEIRPIRLRSGVTLELADGARLLASTNLEDYVGYRAVVDADCVTNVALVGRGTIDGRGRHFREPKPLPGAAQPTVPMLLRFHRCKDVRIEGVTYRQSGSWGMHLRNCDGVVVRGVTCFNHNNRQNDGIDIESRNVLIEDCDIDADDDAIAVKAESDREFAVTNVVIRNCRLASMAYPFKIGTGSYADVRDVLVENCSFPRTKMNHRFPWSKLSVGITNDISGICGIGIQCVDGGRLENVTVRNVDIEGYNVPISMRLGRRHDPAPGKATFLRKVLVENVTAVAEGPTASSIVGSRGLDIEDVTLRNVRLTLTGGATAADVSEVFPNEKGYPGPAMFKSILPVCGLYTNHVQDVRLENVNFRFARPDERPAR